MNVLDRLRNRRHAEPITGDFRDDMDVTDALAAVPDPVPHGIATPETLASILARAQAVQDDGEGETWWGMTRMDSPPAHDRRYVPQAATLAAFPPPPMPYSGISSIWVAQIAYPEPGDLSYDHARNYTETLRHVGRATGTSTSLEQMDAWPQFAIEAGTEAAA